MDWEKLGEKFPYLENDVKEAVLSILKASEREDREFNIISFYSGLGREINNIEDTWIKRINDECNEYPSVCEGLARGISELKEIKKEKFMTLISSKLMAIYVLSKIDLSIPTLKDGIIYAIDVIKEEKNLGEVGKNFGENYRRMPIEIKEKMKELLNNSSFAYEFLRAINLNEFSDIYNFKNSEVMEVIGEKFNQLNDFQKRKILFSADRGLGRGIGKIFDSLTYSWKLNIIEEAKNNKEFALGLIECIDLEYIQDKVFFELLNIALKDCKLSFAMGTNLGQNFSYLTEDLKSKVEEITFENKEFAKGIGNGFSITFNKFFDLFMNYKELKEEDEIRILNLALKNKDVAEGILQNLSYIILSKHKNKILKLVENNEQYIEKFLKLLNRRVNEFDIDELFNLAKGKYMVELGKILCENFPQLNKEKRKKIIEKIENRDFYQGFLECGDKTS
ncbi:hypothetical protein [Acidianus brierleyi]|uniref:Uncharacterized protein n=1 Tax=Acidianus brierleyi TaxID=41673 RepID=A0A2U9IGY2_9CREN|nr:hypothetical protein [Acidianus brierleyi]AWR95250.1 hypothetical protein DFR85_12230 [Acidianus brierleyi]